MKLNHLISALFSFVLAVSAGAQSLEDYLAVRKKFGITRAADSAAIDSLVGKSVIEVKGTVKGVIGSGESEMLMLIGPQGEEHFVHSGATPDWLKTGQVPVRLIVNVERASENSRIYVNLICAANERDIAAIEAKANRKVAPVTTPKVRTGGSKTSRKGGRPDPIPGDIPKPTTNPVGEPKAGIGDDIAKVLPTYIDFIKKRNRRLTDDQADRIARGILTYSSHFGVDARLIVAIIITESDFDPNETSHAGAMGLGQLMPVNKQELGLTDAYDIEQNLYGTVKLVRGHIDKYSKQTDDSFEALVLALAGYNAGDGAVKKYGGVPPYRETQNYVKKVISIYKQLSGN